MARACFFELDARVAPPDRSHRFSVSSITARTKGRRLPRGAGGPFGLVVILLRENLRDRSPFQLSLDCVGMGSDPGEVHSLTHLHERENTTMISVVNLYLALSAV